MSRRQSKDILIESDLFVLKQSRQVITDLREIEAPGYFGMCEERFDLSRERENRGRQMIVERLDAEVVTGTEQCVSSIVKDCKGKIPDKLFWTVVSPLQVRRENQLRVGDVVCVSGVTQNADELRSIVEPRIGSDYELAAF